MVANRCIKPGDTFDVVSEHRERASLEQMSEGLMVASKV